MKTIKQPNLLMMQSLFKRHKITICVIFSCFRINEVCQDFGAKIQTLDAKIAKTQNSRPRGNPAKKWPHTPMSSTDKKFWTWKETRERTLHAERDVLIANRDGFIEMEQSRINQLTSMLSDINTIIKILQNRLRVNPKPKDELKK